MSQHHPLPTEDAHLRPLVHGQLLQGGEQLRGESPDWWVPPGTFNPTRYSIIYMVLINSTGQRDKPFVNDEENNLRTPRPDLLDRPYAPDYSGESFRSQYKVRRISDAQVTNSIHFSFSSNCRPARIRLGTSPSKDSRIPNRRRRVGAFRLPAGLSCRPPMSHRLSCQAAQLGQGYLQPQRLAPPPPYHLQSRPQQPAGHL